jgi:hypothetical protein
MKRSLTLVIATAVLLAPTRARAQQAARGAERWTIADRAPCTGLTIGWALTTAELRRVLGPGLDPAPGATPDTGILLLFVAQCPGSTIGARRTAPFVTAHIIVPIEPPEAAGDSVARGVRGWIAIPTTFGDTASPVRALFQRHGFAVRQGMATLRIDSTSQGTRARLTLSTPRGRLESEATFADSVRRFESLTGIVGPGTRAHALAHGPEHSLRRSGRTATVSTRGTTILSGLHPVGKPVAVLDTDFAWRFTFEPPPQRE